MFSIETHLGTSQTHLGGSLGALTQVVEGLGSASGPTHSKHNVCFNVFGWSAFCPLQSIESPQGGKIGRNRKNTGSHSERKQE